VRKFLFRVVVEGESMGPALAPGDRLLVLRTRRLRARDIVAIPDPRDPDRTMIKRIDSVDRNDVRVLGDNADASTDSRHFGPVRRHDVRGRAFYRYAPQSRRGKLTR
jgi:nickel-type superoxide dismutase maturation protease